MKIFSPSITGSLNLTGSLVITGSFRLEPTDANTNEVFLIKNSVGQNLFIISQSGVVQFATQSTDPFAAVGLESLMRISGKLTNGN